MFVKNDAMTPKDLNLSTWEQLYDYILESKFNGQRKQSLEIYNSLTKYKRVMFFAYIIDLYEEGLMGLTDMNETFKYFSKL
jgi:hypothetical protein